jgi:hypothetical protein
MIRRIDDFDGAQRDADGDDRVEARGKPRRAPGRRTLRRLVKQLSPIEVGALLHRFSEGREGADRNTVQASAGQGAAWTRRLEELCADAEFVETRAQELPEKLRSCYSAFSRPRAASSISRRCSRSSVASTVVATTSRRASRRSCARASCSRSTSRSRAARTAAPSPRPRSPRSRRATGQT